MFGVSIPEILLVCAVVLIVLGPDRLPDAIRTFGKFMAQFRSQADAVRREIYNSVYTPAEDLRKDFREVRQDLRAVKESAQHILPLSPEELLTCEEKAERASQNEKASEERAISKNDSELPEPDAPGEDQ